MSYSRAPKKEELIQRIKAEHSKLLQKLTKAELAQLLPSEIQQTHSLSSQPQTTPLTPPTTATQTGRKQIQIKSQAKTNRLKQKQQLKQKLKPVKLITRPLNGKRGHSITRLEQGPKLYVVYTKGMDVFAGFKSSNEQSQFRQFTWPTFPTPAAAEAKALALVARKLKDGYSLCQDLNKTKVTKATKATKAAFAEEKEIACGPQFNLSKVLDQNLTQNHAVAFFTDNESKEKYYMLVRMGNKVSSCFGSKYSEQLRHWESSDTLKLSTAKRMFERKIRQRLEARGGVYHLQSRAPNWALEKGVGSSKSVSDNRHVSFSKNLEDTRVVDSGEVWGSEEEEEEEEEEYDYDEDDDDTYNEYEDDEDDDDEDDEDRERRHKIRKRRDEDEESERRHRSRRDDDDDDDDERRHRSRRKEDDDDDDESKRRHRSRGKDDDNDDDSEHRHKRKEEEPVDVQDNGSDVFLFDPEEDGEKEKKGKKEEEEDDASSAFSAVLSSETHEYHMFLRGNVLHKEHGLIGKKMTKETVEYPTIEKAEAACRKLLSHKLNRGFYIKEAVGSN